MKFYKYRTRWSHGIHDWEYTSLPDNTSKEEIKDYFDNLSEENNWSEHYRGLDYFKIKHPPKKWFEDNIKWTKLDIKNKKLYLKELQEIYGASNRK
jgi:hypothetical protein